MEKSGLDRIVEKLESNGRVFTLILGPEFINIDSKEVDFTTSIQDYLITTKLQDQVNGHYFSDDGFLHIDDLDEKFDIHAKIKEFYKEKTVSEPYELLAKIPFTSIISLSPDDLIVKAFQKINKEYIFSRYSKKGFEDLSDIPTKEKPLIYNLMGHYNEEESLVFTFDSLFDFLNRLFQDTGFPKFREHIQNADDLLFLGFNYNKWYLKLCFYFLQKIKRTGKDFSRYAVFDYKKKETEFNPKIRYYKDFHKLKFSPDNEKEFIRALYDSCQEKGVLSEVKNVQGVQDEILTEKGGFNRFNLDADHKYKILFFTSSPDTKMVLKAGEQYQQISDSMNKRYYELLKPKYSLTRNGIPTEVNSNEPNLLYFHCHGNDQGELILSGENNQPDKMPLEDLKEVLQNLLKVHKQINCIVFSACKSEKQAQEISKMVPCCIGMNQSVLEEVSSIFTKGFFEAFIRDGQNFEYAFKNGVLAIKNSEKADFRVYFDIPVMYKAGELYKISD
jgi:hypothetical protein